MTTRKSKTAQATCKHFQWLNQIKADRELLPSAFIIAFEIGQHFNRKRGGAAWPSYLTIANAVGLDEATVVRLVRRLHQRGHIKIEPGKRGRGHPNRYFMVVQKPARAQVSQKIKPASEPLKPAPTQENLLEPLMGNAKAFPHKVERDRANAHAPLDVAGALKGAAPSFEEEDASKKENPCNTENDARFSEKGGEKNVVTTFSRSPETSADASNVVVLGADTFAELAEIWARPWADDEAVDRMAFAKALREGADPAEIVEAAKCWAAAADAPRYLQPLAKWLNGRGWEKAPPTRRRRHHGQSMGDYMREQIKAEQPPIIRYETLEVAS
jgi:hypothetical protein